MVGAIADWFAVTALFRHPLGLPIPHTALIPKRKEELGRSLEEFVGENFLQEDIIRERIAAPTISRRRGRWLGDPANARRVVDEVADVAVIALGKVRDDHIAELVDGCLGAALPRGADRPARSGACWPRWSATTCTTGWSTWCSRSCTAGWSPTPTPSPRCSASARPWWAPPRLNEAVTHGCTLEAVRWLEDIRNDLDHHAREALDSMLASSPRTCSRTRDTQERAERLKDRMLDHPQVVPPAISLWNALRRRCSPSLEDPDGAVRRGCCARSAPFAERLGPTTALRGGSTGRRRPRRLRGLALRRGADHRDHPHHRAMGRQGGRAEDRAARRAATCSSSGSTAPSSAASSAC